MSLVLGKKLLDNHLWGAIWAPHKGVSELNDGTLKLYIIVQGLVTVALLGFAWAMREADRTMGTVVVTAVIAHWLTSGASVAKTITDRAAARARA